MLSNPEKQRELLQLQEQHDVNFIKALWFGGSSDPENRAQAGSTNRWPTTSSRPSRRLSTRSSS